MFGFGMGFHSNDSFWKTNDTSCCYNYEGSKGIAMSRPQHSTRNSYNIYIVRNSKTISDNMSKKFESRKSKSKISTFE